MRFVNLWSTHMCMWSVFVVYMVVFNALKWQLPVNTIYVLSLPCAHTGHQFLPWTRGGWHHHPHPRGAHHAAYHLPPGAGPWGEVSNQVRGRLPIVLRCWVCASVLRGQELLGSSIKHHCALLFNAFGSARGDKRSDLSIVNFMHQLGISQCRVTTKDDWRH